MNTERITINDKSLSAYGVTLLEGSYTSLMTPAPIKPWVSNDAVNSDGVDYIVPTDEQDNVDVKVAERTLTLYFMVKGTDEANFLSNYNHFVGALQRGWVNLYIPDFNRTYKLKTEGCTPFDKFNLLSCKLAVKFTEPKPVNYSAEYK